ncbi:hypothetical protein [Streptomyces sp. NPDC018000]|uniref:hypothetical protein n=1 Tax=Streptomyces sp. NPDC018000 TaxID=3365028 RepID=UPI0037B6C50A
MFLPPDEMLAALDPATGKLYYLIRPRKCWREFLGNFAPDSPIRSRTNYPARAV